MLVKVARPFVIKLSTEEAELLKGVIHRAKNCRSEGGTTALMEFMTDLYYDLSREWEEDDEYTT